MADPKINKHFFHGVYSNGYGGNLKNKWNYPLHFLRAEFAKDVEGGGIKEFDSEEEALEFYKGYSSSEKPSICKNYIRIPESEFYQYRGLFHGMIKGIKFEAEVDMTLEGSIVLQTDCVESKSAGSPELPRSEQPQLARTPTIVFNNPGGGEGYYVASAYAYGGIYTTSPVAKLYVNGSPGTNGLIEKKGSSVSFYAEVFAVNPSASVEAWAIWFNPVPFKQEIKHSIKYDSTKIFDIPELQKRIGADYITHNMKILGLNAPNNLQTYEELYLGGELFFDSYSSLFSSSYDYDPYFLDRIFKREWLTPSSYTSQVNRFNTNATFFNDPVLVPISPRCLDETLFPPSLDSLLEPLGMFFDAASRCSDGGCGFSTGLDFTNYWSKPVNFEKNFDKLGLTKLEVSGTESETESMEMQLFNSRFAMTMTRVFYIKPLKIFMCFLELRAPYLQVSSRLTKLICSNTYGESFSFDGSGFVLRPFTTGDPSEESVWVNTDSCPYYYGQSEESKHYLNYKIVKCPLKIGSKNLDFEIQQLVDDTIEFTNECVGWPLDQDYKKTLKYTIKTPSIEILTWEDKDFDEKNTFPPKYE